MHAASAIIILYIVYKFMADREIPRGYIYIQYYTGACVSCGAPVQSVLHESPFIYQYTGQSTCKSE